MALNAFRYLGFTSMVQVDRLELPEYQLLMKALALRRVDEEYRVHEQAFLNTAARATKGKSGRPVYKKFSSFFDYDEAVKKVQNGEKHRSIMQKVSALLKEKKEKKNG